MTLDEAETEGPKAFSPVVFVCGLEIHKLVTGSSSNSISLLSALAKHASRLYVAIFWLVGWGRPRLPRLGDNSSLFWVPIVEGFWPMHAFVLLAYSFLHLLVVCILKAARGLDVILVSDPLLAYALFRFKALHSTPVVVRFTSIEESDSNTRIKVPFVRRLMMSVMHKVSREAAARADALIAPSSSFAEVLKTRYDLSTRSRVLTIPPVLQTTAWPEVVTTKPSDAAEIRIGYLGSLLPYQGVDILLESMVRVQALFPGAVLYVVGGDRRSLESCRKEARRLGVKVVFTGPVPHGEALSLLRTFYVLVAPRRRGSATELLIPMKILEAFALGTPVIVTRHRCLSDFAQDRVHVLFVNPSPEDVSRAIAEVIQDPGLRQTLAQNGRKLTSVFDADANAVLLSGLLLELTMAKGK